MTLPFVELALWDHTSRTRTFDQPAGVSISVPTRDTVLGANTQAGNPEDELLLLEKFENEAGRLSIGASSAAEMKRRVTPDVDWIAEKSDELVLRAAAVTVSSDVLGPAHISWVEFMARPGSFGPIKRLEAPATRVGYEEPVQTRTLTNAPLRPFFHFAAFAS